MLLGESSAELALGQQRAPPPVSLSASTSVKSLFGHVDCPVLYAQGWEKVVEEHKPGLHYWVHRRHVRKGLYMYRSRTGQITPYHTNLEQLFHVLSAMT
jgi:hypothetical protein